MDTFGLWARTHAVAGCQPREGGGGAGDEDEDGRLVLVNAWSLFKYRKVEGVNSGLVSDRRTNNATETLRADEVTHVESQRG